MMKNIKKLFAIVLSVLIAVSILGINADAVSKTEILGTCVAQKYNAYYPNSIKKLENYVDIDELHDYLYTKIYNCEKTINIKKFNIPATSEMLTAIWSLIEDEMYELFNIVKLEGMYDNTGKIMATLKAEYEYTKSTFKNMYAKVMQRTEELTKDIKNTAGLTDVEKALLLHDRIALNCEYNYDYYNANTLPWKNYTMYGVLVDGIAVCQGYAEAYGYLLEQVGVKNEICISNSLNHAWNIVYIDGKKYHVDVTWDDSPYNWDVKGAVSHNNFLLSTNALRQGVNGYSGHNAWDYDSSPVSQIYDSYFWQDSYTAFYLLDGEIYYFDNTNSSLKRYSDKQNLLNVSDLWSNKNGQIFKDNYTKLSCDGVNLYYSTPKKIYTYNPLNNTKKAAYSPSGFLKGESIYGMAYENGQIVYDVSTSPLDTPMKRNYYSYDESGPIISSYTTNNADKKQTVTVTLSDYTDVSGYWWGENYDYSKNEFKSVSSDTTFNITVSKEGTYYITAVDTLGNISNTYYFIYRKTVLDNNGGTGSYDYLITVGDYTVTPKEPIKGGYIFKGWTLDGKTVKKSITPTSDQTYKAVWEINPKPALYKINGIQYYYKNGVIDKSNTLCKHTDGKWYHVKGGKRVYDTTLVKYNGTYYYVKNGVKNTSNTLVKYSGKWYHVKGGKRVYDTTLVKYNGTYYYVKNGVKNTSNTLVKYSGKWYHVKGGKRVYDTTLVKYNGTYYYVKNGVKNTSNTLVKYSGKWYHVKGGKRVYDTAIVKYNGKRYYVKNGIVKFITKTVKIGKKYYKIKNGIVK